MPIQKVAEFKLDFTKLNVHSKTIEFEDADGSIKSYNIEVPNYDFRRIKLPT